MINAKYGKPKKLRGIEQSLFLTFRYKENVVNAIRKITPRYWHNEEKMWELAYDSVSELKELLPKEEFNITGEPIDDKRYGEKVVDHSITLPKALVTKLYPYQKETFDEGMAFERYIYNLDQGLGKAQPLYSKILTPSGFVDMGSICVGDLVLGEDGNSHKVLGVFPQGKKKIYELVFSDGSKCRCSEDHLWSMHCTINHNKIRDVTVRDMLELGLYRLNKHSKGVHKQWRFSLPYNKPMKFSDTCELPVDPWLFGLLLGDGSFRNHVSVSIYESDIREKVVSILKSYQLSLGSPYVGFGDFIIVDKSGLVKNKYNHPLNRLVNIIRKLGLYNHKSENKFIPDIYKYSSPQDRLALIQGLFDADGYTYGASFGLSTSSKQLADDVIFIIHSLGGTCSCNEHETFYTVNGEKKQGLNNFELYIKLPNDMLPFTSDKHKKAMGNSVRHTNPYRKLRNVTYIGEEECQCIYVDNPSHLYITDDFIPTHNTNCTIATILKRIELGQINKVLILPAMNLLKYTWENEVNKHTTGVKCKILGNRQNSKGIWLTKGTKEKLEDLNNLEDDVSIYVTNIESIREKTITDKLVKLMDKGVFNCIVVDESHKIVSPSAQQSKALLRLTNHVKYVYLLTGTILMNRPDDLYIPLKITGAFTGNFSNFRSRYDVLGGWGGYQVVGHKHLDELQAKLMSVSKRLRKVDVLKQLPPKIYVEEFLDMSVKQKKIYKDVLNAIMADIDNIKLSINPLSQMIRLRQATADTSILSSTVKESVKFDRALELIQEIIERNESVIVFSCWETVVSNFRKFLSENHLTSAIITGKIKDREGQIKYFNENDDCHIIVGTVGAMGVGLTLNKASNVIFLDESWSASEKLQCEDRCHRIGQTETVTVITLVCKHTIDENIHSIVKRKGALGDALVDHKYDLKDEKVLNYLLTGEGELD